MHERPQFLLSTLTNALAPLLELSILAPASAAPLRAAQALAAQALLPDLVGLTDSFGFSDWELDTTVRSRALSPTLSLSRSLEGDRPDAALLLPPLSLSRAQVGNADGAVYERMLAKAKADEELNLGTKAEQERLYREYIKPVLERGKRRAGRTDEKL